MQTALNCYVLLTLLCWGVWGIFDKKALHTSTHMGVLFRLYVMSLWETPLIYLYAAISQPGFHISPAAWYWTGLAAVSQVISFGAYLVAMSITDASLVLGVTAAYPIITQLLAVSWLGEHFVFNRVFGALAIAAGVLAIGSSHHASALQLDRRKKLQLIGCVVFATLGWGVWGILDKLAIMHGSTVEVWLAECIWELGLVILAGAVGFTRGVRVEVKSKPAWVFALLSALCLAFGRYTFLSALQLSSASYVLTITGCYPLLMYFFAVLLLREKFSRVRFAGILLVVAGGIAVQLTQAV